MPATYPDPAFDNAIPCEDDRPWQWDEWSPEDDDDAAEVLLARIGRGETLRRECA